MTKEEYIKRIKAHQNEFTKLWKKLLADTDLHKQASPDTNMYSYENSLQNLFDDMILSGAWLYDRIDDIPHKSKKSLTYKLRKALGYSYP